MIVCVSKIHGKSAHYCTDKGDFVRDVSPSWTLNLCDGMCAHPKCDNDVFMQLFASALEPDASSIISKRLKQIANLNEFLFKMFSEDK